MTPVAAPETLHAWPPGPRRRWIVGHLVEFMRDALGFLERCAREHGDYVPIRFMNNTALFINDHQAIEEVLVTQSQNFPKHMQGNRVFGNGLLTSEGAFWARQRKMTQPAFHRRRVSAYAPAIVDCIEGMLSGWKDGETLSVQDELARLTERVIVKAIFNSGVSPEIEEYVRLTEESVERDRRRRQYVVRLGALGLLAGMAPDGFKRRLDSAIDRVDAYIYRTIQARRAAGEDQGDILSMLLDARDDQDQGMTDAQVRDEVMTLIAAGLDTTLLAMTWSCYLLARNPAAADRLHEELRAVLQGRPAEMADLPALKYTDAVLREAMRLYPPAWIVVRQAAADCVVQGYPIVKGATVMMSQWVKHRDGRLFDRPDEFEPGRWLSQSAPPKCAYFPFGGGSRFCIGSSLAMIEAPLGLARICQRFRFECDPGYEVKPWGTLTLHPMGGVHLRIRTLEGKRARPPEELSAV